MCVSGTHAARTPFFEVSGLRGVKPADAIDDVFRLLGGVPATGSLEMRDRAILEVLYSTGIRVSELVGLDWEDIDFRLGILKVLGKGSKERIVPVGEVALQALRDYGVEQGKKGSRAARGETPVFLNRLGRSVPWIPCPAP